MTTWQTKKLGDICVFQRGLTYSKKDEVNFSDNIVLRANNVDLESHLLNLNELKFINNKVQVHDEKKVKRGSVIMCTASGSKNHLGKVALIDDDYDYAFGGFMAQLTPKEDIDSKYFFYELTSDSFNKHLAKISSGANINNLKFSDIKDFPVNVPPLTEQKRIVKKLDEVFEKVTKAKEAAEKNLQNAKDLFESYLNNVFANPGKDWEEKKLEELYQVGSSKRVLKSQWQKEGVPFYRGREITRLATDGYVNNELFISEEHYQRLLKQSGVPKAGDIVITAIGTIGNLHIVRADDRFYFKDASVLWLKRLTNVSSEFIKFWLNSVAFFKQLDKGNGATVDTLTIKKLQSVQLYIPSLQEQKKIVNKFNSFSAETKMLERIYEQKLADLEELKKSILSKAFHAEL